MSKLVTISLDDLSYEAFLDIPKGSRSRVVRECILNGQILHEKDCLIAALRQGRDYHTTKIKQLEDKIWILEEMNKKLKERNK